MFLLSIRNDAVLGKVLEIVNGKLMKMHLLCVSAEIDNNSCPNIEVEVSVACVICLI